MAAPLVIEVVRATGLPLRDGDGEKKRSPYLKLHLEPASALAAAAPTPAPQRAAGRAPGRAAQRDVEARLGGEFRRRRVPGRGVERRRGRDAARPARPVRSGVGEPEDDGRARSDASLGLDADDDEALGLLLRADGVWSSPLTRAVQTALVGLHGHPALDVLELHATAREIKGMGGLDCVGLEVGAANIGERVERKLARWWVGGSDYETGPEVALRYGEFCRELQYESLCGGRRKPVIVGHSMFIRGLFERFLSDNVREKQPAARGGARDAQAPELRPRVRRVRLRRRARRAAGHRRRAAALREPAFEAPKKDAEPRRKDNDESKRTVADAKAKAAKLAEQTKAKTKLFASKARASALKLKASLGKKAGDSSPPPPEPPSTPSPPPPDAAGGLDDDDDDELSYRGPPSAPRRRRTAAPNFVGVSLQRVGSLKDGLAPDASRF
ncbi:phosphoglycerate mutase [Aureococcus anophagefferens]|nr:phosphoglycerate mutase [Aureococcus anophagefferens]